MQALTVNQDSFYKPLTAEQSAKAFRNEYDFDSPDAIDFDVLIERLRDLKRGYGQFVSCPILLIHRLQDAC